MSGFAFSWEGNVVPVNSSELDMKSDTPYTTHIGPGEQVASPSCRWRVMTAPLFRHLPHATFGFPQEWSLGFEEYASKQCCHPISCLTTTSVAGNNGRVRIGFPSSTTAPAAKFLGPRADEKFNFGCAKNVSST